MLEKELLSQKNQQNNNNNYFYNSINQINNKDKYHDEKNINKKKDTNNYNI
jgi:hypothetical protein